MRRITHNRRGLGDFDVWGIGFLLLVILAAAIFGRKQLMVWIRSAGRMKYQYKMGEMEGKKEFDEFQKSLQTQSPTAPTPPK